MNNAIPTRIPEKTLLKRPAKMSQKKKKGRSLLSILGPKGGVYDDQSKSYLPRSAKHHGATTLKESARSSYDFHSETPNRQGFLGRATDEVYSDGHEGRTTGSKLRKEMDKHLQRKTSTPMPGTPLGSAKDEDDNVHAFEYPTKRQRPKKGESMRQYMDRLKILRKKLQRI